MGEKHAYIHLDDMNLINLVDTAEEAVAVINAFYSKYMLKPNF
jgi:predicted Rossmann-fold nucleotide-binding protein